MITTALKVIFTIVCCCQMALVLVNLVFGIMVGDMLVYIGLVDLVFPIMALVFIYRYDPDRRRSCASPPMLIVYMLWCAIWIVVGILLILVRANVFVYDSSNFIAVALLGAPTHTSDIRLVVTNAIQLGLQALGLALGIATFCVMNKPADDDEERKGGDSAGGRVFL